MSAKRKTRKNVIQDSVELPKYKQVTNIIFDCDGTLLDTEGIRRRAIEKCVQSRNGHITEESVDIILGRTDLDMMKLVIAETGIDEVPILLLKDFLRECQDLLPFCDIMPGAEKIVRSFYINGVPMAVATSSSIETMNLKTQNHKDMFGLFDFITVAGSDPGIKKGKPAPDIYLQTASKFSCSPLTQKCLVFEDSPSGVGAAVSAGMQVVMIPDPNLDPSLSTDATLVLSSLSEFVPNQFGLTDFII